MEAAGNALAEEAPAAGAAAGSAEEFALDFSWVLTFLVGFGLAEGARFDWKSRRWHSQ